MPLRPNQPLIRRETLKRAGETAKRIGGKLNSARKRVQLKNPEKIGLRKYRHDQLRKAVYQGDADKKGLMERAFALAFRGLVYSQIWEDPEIDLEALQLGPQHDLITIASGGCNVMSYLIAEPRSITAVDLNRGHVALNRLKLAAAQNLPDYETFYRFFGQADSRANPQIYDRYLKPVLDPESRRYWERRDPLGRRRISFFARNVYRYGLLGTFIGAGHKLARILGGDPSRLLEAHSLAEQRAIFEREVAPLFEKKVVKWLVDQPMSLYGLGIPPAQYKALAASGGGNIKQVLLERLERLACDFEIDDNYFAHQAFGRRYGEGKAAPLPPYLKPENFDKVRAGAARVNINLVNLIDLLKTKPAGSFDRYVLLDAQDWMNDATLTALWTEITRTAKPGARVIFRTAAEESVLPGRIPADILARWDYDAAEGKAFTKRDRSSIYGGFHLYKLKAA